MASEVVRKFRHSVPEAHQGSIDTRLLWMYNQRFGTVQMIWQSAPDTSEDKLAATIILQAIIGNDLNNIGLLYKRLEGGPTVDEVTLEGVLTL